MRNQDKRDASPAGSIDSLFDEGTSSVSSAGNAVPASRSAPSVVQGLFLLRDILRPAYVEQLLEQVQAASYFDAPRGIDQIMLFGKPCNQEDEAAQSGLPIWAIQLLVALKEETKRQLDTATHRLLFDSCKHNSCSTTEEHGRLMATPIVPSSAAGGAATSTSSARARQLILNLYAPGTGISSHVDLPSRYGDGIMGLSLGSGCVMDFSRRNSTSELERASLYLPSNSLVVLTGAARWEWKHGIAERKGDWVLNESLDETSGASGQARYILRQPRLSITARWMKRDAHVVGGAREVTRGDDTHDSEMIADADTGGAHKMLEG